MAGKLNISIDYSKVHLPEQLAFQKKLEELTKVKNTSILDKYQGAIQKITCKCNECGRIWKVFPSTIFQGWGGCKKCAMKKRKTLSS
mgnify:CR=1 FL=1